MRTYLMACAAAVALLAAAGPRASAWCHFDCCISFSFSRGCDCPTCDNCCCGWPGYHFDCCGGDAYPGVDYGYPTAGYPAPAGGSAAPATSSPSFPPAPKPVDGGRTSSYGYPGYGPDAAGYAGYGYSSGGYYGGGTGYGPQVPSYWYGR